MIGRYESDFCFEDLLDFDFLEHADDLPFLGGGGGGGRRLCNGMGGSFSV